MMTDGHSGTAGLLHESRFTLTSRSGMLESVDCRRGRRLHLPAVLQPQESVMKAPSRFLIAAILVFATAASAAERPTAEELLTAFEKSVDKFDRVRIDWS